MQAHRKLRVPGLLGILRADPLRSPGSSIASVDWCEGQQLFPPGRSPKQPMIRFLAAFHRKSRLKRNMTEGCVCAPHHGIQDLFRCPEQIGCIPLCRVPQSTQRVLSLLSWHSKSRAAAQGAARSDSVRQISSIPSSLPRLRLYCFSVELFQCSWTPRFSTICPLLSVYTVPEGACATSPASWR